MTTAWEFIAGLVFFTGAVVALDAWNSRTQTVDWKSWMIRRFTDRVRETYSARRK